MGSNHFNDSVSKKTYRPKKLDIKSKLMCHCVSSAQKITQEKNALGIANWLLVFLFTMQLVDMMYRPVLLSKHYRQWFFVRETNSASSRPLCNIEARPKQVIKNQFLKTATLPEQFLPGEAYMSQFTDQELTKEIIEKVFREMFKKNYSKKIESYRIIGKNFLFKLKQPIDLLKYIMVS